MTDKMPIGLAGLGLMGSSIATAILAAGHPVTAIVLHISEKEEATKRITDFLLQMQEENLLKEPASQIVQRLVITTDITQLADHSVIIESITENLQQKKKLYADLEKVIAPGAIIGSNTSALPVSTLQSDLQHPQRLIGIHWAEPAHITRFMEIICGGKTDIENAHKIMALAESWGKEPSLLKKDIRGFITNRVMYAMLREAFHLVENGYATVEDVDRSLRNDLGYWITFAGPFRFMDITGIPAYLTVMKDLFPELDNSASAPATIEKLVTAGARGTANAKGFYSYTHESAEQWEKLFVQFSYEIRKLAEKYPQNAGDLS
ncbi:MAG: 3-hydroxyacyl-CoA dehydrogenase family protein [Agriterribacter sp.]